MGRRAQALRGQQCVPGLHPTAATSARADAQTQRLDAELDALVKQSGLKHAA